MECCTNLKHTVVNRMLIPFRLFLKSLCLLLFLITSIQAHETQAPDNKDVTAIRLNTEQRIDLDGRLDEPIWQIAKPATDFIQKELDYGSPAQQEAEVRFTYDEENLYIGIRCFDDKPNSILKPMSRSESDMNAGDVLNLFIDSRHDHRTGYRISVNPSGMRGDEARYNDYLKDNSWDGFWWVETHIDSLGWTAEIKLPFKNFRFETLGEQTWGLNIERRVPRINEQSYWKKVSLDDGRFTRMSKLGHLTGIHDIKQGRRIEVVPYGLVGTTRADAIDTDLTTETGLDIKYALTSSLTLDATVNPDFAQVDADVDEINLTRFPTRFPEQRPFFVEGNNTFLTPIELFYSRRIGGRADILGGGKISGKVGPYTIGLITVQTGDWTYFGIQDDDAAKEDATFGIMRLKRDIFSKSTIGLVFADKEYGNAYSRVAGVDLSLRPSDLVLFNAQIAGSWQPGLTEGNIGFTSDISRIADASSAKFFYERLSPDFDVNQTGFLRKESHRGRERMGLDLVYSPRPDIGSIKQIYLTGFVDAQRHILTNRYLNDQTASYPTTVFSPDFLNEKRGFGGGTSLEVRFNSGSSAEVFASKQRRYDITGGYDSDSLRVSVRTPSQYKVAFQASAFLNDFYNFNRRHVSRAWSFTLDTTLTPLDRWRVETRLRHSRTFDPSNTLEDRIWLGSLRTFYLFSPDTFLSVFVQGRSDHTPLGTQKTFLISNVFGWEFTRGSRLFVAINDSRDDGTGTFRLNNQTFVLKIVRSIDL